MTDLGTLPQNDGASEAGKSGGGESAGRVFSDVLCAVNGTRRSFAAVEQAAILAGNTGHLTLLSVTAVSGTGAYRTASISPPRAERILEQAARMAHDAKVPCDSVLDHDSPPPQVVLERAAAHELLAIGAPRGSWIAGKVRDSVSAAMMGSLTTPLLVARAPHNEVGFAQRIVIASDGEDGSDELVALAARIGREHGSRAVLVSAAGIESHAHPHRIQEQARQLDEALDGRSELRVEVADAAEAIVRTAKETDATLVVMGSRGIGGLRALGSVSRRVVGEAHCSVLLIPPERLRRQLDG